MRQYVIELSVVDLSWWLLHEAKAHRAEALALFQGCLPLCFLHRKRDVWTP